MKPLSGQSKGSPYTSSGAWIAIICGIVVAFFLSPILYDLSIPFVLNTAYRYYPAVSFPYIGYGTWAIWAGILFFLTRALVYALVVMAGYAVKTALLHPVVATARILRIRHAATSSHSLIPSPRSQGIVR